MGHGKMLTHIWALVNNNAVTGKNVGVGMADGRRCTGCDTCGAMERDGIDLERWSITPRKVMEYKTIIVIHRKNKEIIFFLREGETFDIHNIVDVDICTRAEPGPGCAGWADE